MTQAMTLHSSFPQRILLSRQLLNPFLILPPEILSLILENINLDIVNTVQTLLLVDVQMKLCLNLAIPYVSRMSAHKPLMLNLFTGVKHLEIINRISIQTVNIYNFEKIMFRNLKYLSIPRYVSFYLSKLDNTRMSRFFMPILDVLRIYSEYMDKDPPSYICSKSVPKLRTLILDRFMASNLGEFKTLEILKLRYVNINPSMLNDLNIVELSLDNVGFHTSDTLNIPSLRILKLIEIEYGDYVLNFPYLRSLEIIEGYFDGTQDEKLLNNPNLEELTLKNITLDGVVLNNPNLKILKLINAKHLYAKNFRV